MSFSIFQGGGPSSAIIPGDKWGYQDAEKMRQNFNALATIRHVHPLGGSRNQGLAHGAVVDAYDYVDVEIDNAEIAGLSVIARVEVRVQDASISVTPSIRNVTDAADAATGVACSATNADYSGTNQKQSLTVTLAPGKKTYRLRLTPSAATFQVFGIGVIEIYYDGNLAISTSPADLEMSGTAATLTLSP